MAAHRFNVSSRLALLLGESYRTIEQALKELVDNAWDADASIVRIAVPEGPEADPVILIADDGEGMSPGQIDTDYLRIARDRRKDRGPRTKSGRLVKGRKGIGKFAGIIIAGHMQLVTRRDGKKSTVVIDRQALENGPMDIEKIDVPVVSVDHNLADHGTTIKLTMLFSHINYPTPTALRHALAPEYGRQDRMRVIVNGELLTHLQIPGHAEPKTLIVPGVGEIEADFVIAEKKQLKAMRGIQVRVTGKSVGDPTMFGLDADEQVPTRLLEHVTGELRADCLEDAATSCGWTEFLESDKSVQAVFAAARDHLKAELRMVFRQQMAAAYARYVKKYGQRIDNLPEEKRERARSEINTILQRFFGDDERIEAAIEVMLRTLERDDHYVIAKKLLSARPGDVATLADALRELSIADLALIRRQIEARLAALEKLHEMALNDATSEKEIHAAIVTTLWVFGYEFALLASNRTLAKVIDDVFGGSGNDEEGALRPDLLLLNRYGGRYLLVEFKRPSVTLNYDHKAQAEGYRGKLKRHADPIDIIVLGGRRRDDMVAIHENGTIRMTTYVELTSRAESELRWLLGELKQSN
ncbi:MAG TPA: ATP-binding protein [Pirellulaceae bacterium]|nr:ATP-binding protein [Pirellulaceae bacterium]